MAAGCRKRAGKGGFEVRWYGARCPRQWLMTELFAATHNRRHTDGMRDIFEQIFDGPPVEPQEAARRSMKPQLRARFYKDAVVGEAADGGHPVLLDGRAVRTPARRPLAAPTQALEIGRAHV